MIDRKDLKPGDEVVSIYTHGYGSCGYASPMVIKKITKDIIIATRVADNMDFDFINDDEMQEVNLARNYLSNQSLRLFLGTVEEARKRDDERCKAESYYSENQDFILSKIAKASLSDLKKIVKILSKYGKDD